MTYIKHENSLSDEEVSLMLEGAGFAIEEVCEEEEEDDELPSLIYEGKEGYFEIDPEIYESDDDLFLRLVPLTEGQLDLITEDTDVLKSFEIDDSVFVLDETIYEAEGEYFVHIELLQEEEAEEDTQELEENMIEIDGEEYFVVEDEDSADGSVFLKTTEIDGEFDVVDSEDEADFVAYLAYPEED